METVLYETPRLVVRHLTAEDADAMHAVYGDAEAMRWVGDGQPLDLSQCVYWVEVTHKNYALRGYGMSTLVERETGAIIGFCGIVHPGGQPEAEIKYALKRAYWGKGFATEAVRGMLDYGHRAFGLTRIIATIAPDNTASRRVLLKAGMQALPPRTNDDGTLTDMLEWRSDSASEQA